MNIVSPSYEILYCPSNEDIVKAIEIAGRTCYKSEDNITPDSAERFVRMILKRGHESVIEHVYMTAKFVCDRGVTHELVRHRLCAFSQESTRYCNYGKGKFGNECTFIKPPFWEESDKTYDLWWNAMADAEKYYMMLLACGAKPQEARDVLPNSLKTEIVVTANVREWRHIFRLRTGQAAHPQMRELMVPLLKEMRQKAPCLFEDVGDIS